MCKRCFIMRSLYTLGLTILLFMVGCSINDNSQNKREQIIHQMNPNQDHYPNQDVRDQLKFVRYKPGLSHAIDDTIL